MILERRKTFIWVLLLALFLGSVFPSGVRLLLIVGICIAAMVGVAIFAFMFLDKR